MYRLARPVSRSFLTAGAAFTAISVYSAGPIHFDEAKPTSPRREKLSIYPKPDPEVILVETHSELEKNIGIAREYVTERYKQGQSAIQSGVEKWIGVEHAVEKQIKDLIPSDEPLTPGLLYVGVATLTGSVLGRNRSFPIRFALPPTFLVLSLAHFLPKLSSNISAYLSSLELAYAPGVAAKHAELNKSVAASLKGASESYDSAKHAVGDKMEWARKELATQTGLKLESEGKEKEMASEKALSDVQKRISEEPKRLV
ncbi:hypothetical protein FRC02_007079 [Tulasnella sp. 418]|nr:hypothetical protein FRC02_007079 [Tulasnella sp. 418]